MLAGYETVDDPLGPKNVTSTTDEDGVVCLHSEIEPYEDESNLGACIECGEEFEINARPSEPDAAGDGVADEPEPEPAAAL